MGERKNYPAEEISPEKYLWVTYILDSHESIANCQPFKLYEESREQNSIVKGKEQSCVRENNRNWKISN